MNGKLRISNASAKTHSATALVGKYQRFCWDTTGLDTSVSLNSLAFLLDRASGSTSTSKTPLSLGGRLIFTVTRRLLPGHEKRAHKPHGPSPERGKGRISQLAVNSARWNSGNNCLISSTHASSPDA